MSDDDASSRFAAQPPASQFLSALPLQFISIDLESSSFIRFMNASGNSGESPSHARQRASHIARLDTLASGTSPDVSVQNRYGGGGRYAAKSAGAGSGSGVHVAPFSDLSPAKSIGGPSSHS